MEYIVTINSLEEIERLNYADSYLFGNNSFSIYSIGSFPLNNLKKIVDKIHFLNKKAYILVNKLFFDNELDKLYKHLKQLKEINVDGIFFSDFVGFKLISLFQKPCAFIMIRRTIKSTNAIKMKLIIAVINAPQSM